MYQDPVSYKCRLVSLGEIRNKVAHSQYPMVSESIASTPTDYYIGQSQPHRLTEGSDQDLGVFKNHLVLASICKSFPNILGETDRTIHAIISDNGSGWVEYMQNLSGASKGFGMADRRGIDFDYTKIYMHSCKFSPYYGDDSSGNFNTYYKSFSNLIVETVSNRVVLVMSDSLRVNPVSVIVFSCSVLADGGNLVMKIGRAHV